MQARRPEPSPPSSSLTARHSPFLQNRLRSSSLPKQDKRETKVILWTATPVGGDIAAGVVIPSQIVHS